METPCKCLISGCENYSDQGTFIGKLCRPCYEYVINEEGIYSQAYRNNHEKLFFIESKFGGYGLTVYLVIRAGSLKDALKKGKRKDNTIENFDKGIVVSNKLVYGDSGNEEINSEIIFDKDGVSNYIGHMW